MEEKIVKEAPQSGNFEEFNVPSILEIKKCIPSKCFGPSLVNSIAYALMDLSLVAGLYFIMTATCDIPILSSVMWPIYWFLQGTFFWGIFVVGHDCGHGSFSRYKWVNDFFGTLLHSFILVPYHFWRLSHKHHHKNTGNYEKDEIFYPEPIDAEEKEKYTSAFKYNYFYLGLGFLFYLVVGYSPRNVSHFNPWNPMFVDHFLEVTFSLISWLAMAELLLSYAWNYGWINLLNYYVIPWFIFATWLVVTTFLHHTEPGVPWFNSKNWNFVLGNLSSVDRDYGVFQTITHHIGTHQVHHLFPMIPHYHLEEATKHFRSTFPQLVRKSDEPIISTFMRNCNVYAKQHLFDRTLEIFKYEKK